MMIEITALFWYHYPMELCGKSAAEWQALLEKREEEIAALHRQVEWLTQQLRLMRGRCFGASSEQTQTLLEQTSLFQDSAYAEQPEPELEQVTYQRRKRRGKRELDLSGLPVEQIVHELPQDEQVCPECGGSMHSCGRQVLRRELH